MLIITWVDSRQNRDRMQGRYWVQQFSYLFEQVSSNKVRSICTSPSSVTSPRFGQKVLRQAWALPFTGRNKHHYKKSATYNIINRQYLRRDRKTYPPRWSPAASQHYCGSSCALSALRCARLGLLRDQDLQARKIICFSSLIHAVYTITHRANSLFLLMILTATCS